MHTTNSSAERHLLVTLRSQPEHGPRVRDYLLELVELVRREPGCLYYYLFEYAEDPHTFVLAAAWVDEAAEKAHPTQARMSQLVELITPLLRVPMDVVPTRRLTAKPT